MRLVPFYDAAVADHPRIDDHIVRRERAHRQGGDAKRKRLTGHHHGC